MQDNLMISFSVSSRSIAIDHDILINATPGFQHLRYGAVLPERAIPLHYVETARLDGANNLLVTNQSVTITSDFTAVGRSFKSSSREIMLTDVFVRDSQGGLTPLFYAYNLPENTSNVTILSGDTLQEVDDTSWLHWQAAYELSDGTPVTENIVFSNFQSDITDKVYYVSYVDANGQQQIKLLDNWPAFRQADIINYNEITSNQRFYTITDVGNGYLVESLFDSRKYSPTNALAGEIELLAWRIMPSSYGSLIQPSLTGISDPWFPQIGNADFYWSGSDGVIRLYQLKEYYDQTFVPYVPYKTCQFTQCQIVSTRLIKLPHSRVMMSIADSLIFDLIVYRNGEPFRAYTSDSTKTYYTDENGEVTKLLYRDADLLQLDTFNGLVLLEETIAADDTVYATYTYKEQYYEYVSLNCNPLFNPDIINEDIWFMLLPTKQPLRYLNIFGTNLITLQGMASQLINGINSLIMKDELTVIAESFWYDGDVIIFDKTDSNNIYNIIESAEYGRILFTNHSNVTTIKGITGASDAGTVTVSPFTFSYIQLGAGYVVDASLTGEDGLISAYTLLDSSDKESYAEIIKVIVDTLSPNIDAAWSLSNSLTYLIFNQSGTVISHNHDFLPLTGKTYAHISNWYSINTGNRCQAILLGNLVINSVLSVHNLKDIDVRVPGGGIKSYLYEQLKETYTQVASCFDHARFDGHPYPGAVAYFIEIPQTILQEYGGKLTRVQVKELIQPYMAAGAYPVIRYYNTTRDSWIS